MKGAISLLTLIILVVIFLVIALPFANEATKIWENKESTISAIFNVLRPYTFDINSLVVKSGEGMTHVQYESLTDSSSPNSQLFCQQLKDAIIKSASENNEWQQVAFSKFQPSSEEVSFANVLYSATGGLCGDGPLFEKVGEEMREVCYFKGSTAMNNKDYYENDTEISGYEPWFHGCFPTKEIEGDFTNIWRICDGTQPENCDNLHVGRGYTFPNGGWMAAYVSASPSQTLERECKLNFTVCGQRAVGNSTNEIEISIFNTTRDRLSEEFACAKWNATTQNCTLLDNSGVIGYYPHFYQFEINETEEVTQESLLTAIDAGFWEWNKLHYDDSSLIGRLPDPLSGARYIHFDYGPWDVQPRTWADCDTARYSFSIMPLTNQPTLYVNQVGAGFSDAKYIRLVYGIKKIYGETKPSVGTSDTDIGECDGLKCPDGNVCADAENKLCCPEDYPNYFDSKCYGSGIRLAQSVLVCTCDKEDCT